MFDAVFMDSLQRLFIAQVLNLIPPKPAAGGGPDDVGLQFSGTPEAVDCRLGNAEKNRCFSFGKPWSKGDPEGQGPDMKVSVWFVEFVMHKGL